MKLSATLTILFLCWNIARIESKLRRDSSVIIRNGGNKRQPISNTIPLKDNEEGNKLSSERDRELSTVTLSTYPFTLTIGPTPEELPQSTIEEISEQIVALLLRSLPTKDASLSVVNGVQLSEEPIVVHKPSIAIDKWRVKMPTSTLDFDDTIVKMDRSFPNNAFSIRILSTAFSEILQQDLLSSLKSNVESLRWLTMLEVQMDMPPTDVPTMTPTKKASGSPTPSPSGFSSIHVPPSIHTKTGIPTADANNAKTDVLTADPTRDVTSKPIPSTSPSFNAKDVPTTNPSNATVKERSPWEENNAGDDDNKDDGKSRDITGITIGISAASAAVIILAALLINRKDKQRSKSTQFFAFSESSDKNDDWDSIQTSDTADGQFTMEVGGIQPLDKLPLTKNPSKLSYDLGWFGSLPGQKSPRLYVETKMSSLEGFNSTNNEKGLFKTVEDQGLQ